MADLYLSPGDQLTGVTFGGKVFGTAATNESVSYTGAATGIIVDANVEEVKLANATSAYNYLQQGTQLVITSGATVVATINLQNDANGTLITFANGRVEAKIVPGVGGAAPTVTVGGTTVPTGTAGPVVPAVIDGSVGTGSQTLTLTAGPDTLTGSGGSDTFNALTVNAAGTAATTLSAFDNLDGGTGEDTLNIYTDDANALNNALPSNFTVKNIEIVNILNADGAADIADASKFGAELKQLNQVGFAANVTGLAAGQTAGYKNLQLIAGQTVTAAATATSAAIALDAVKGKTTDNDASLTVSGAALNTVTVTGTLAQQTANTTPASLALGVTAGKDVQTVTVSSAVNTVLTVGKGGGLGSTKDITTVDASASAGAIKYEAAATTITTIKSGAGADNIKITTATLKDDATTTAVDETVSALVETGAGNDKVNINTSGTGTTTVNTGDGDDTVTLTSDGSGKLTVNLGAGKDTLNVAGAGAVSAGDLIDGGDGIDTLNLSIVGAANIGAFQNFEVFDAKGLGKALDVDILASKNTVTEFITTGDVGGTASLTNVGAGVGYRITGDTTVGNALTLTQKTAGALTVTLDIDETTAPVAATADTDRDAAVITNATSVKAVFDSSFVGKAISVGDNATFLQITGADTKTVEVVSGGTEAINSFKFVGDDTLTTITVTGTQALTLDTSGGTSKLATVDSSGLTGGLTFDLADTQAATGGASTFTGGKVTLGSGDDVITAATGRSIAGIEKGSKADLTAQADFDVVKFALVTTDQASKLTVAGGTVDNGKLTFDGAGPATLDAAIAIANLAANADGETLVFEYLSDSYIFQQDSVGTDIVIKLTGTTGLTGLDIVTGSTNVYVF